MKILAPLGLWCALALAGCTTVSMGDEPAAPLLSGETILCETADVAIRTGYSTSRATNCQTLSKRHFVLNIQPEAMVDPNGISINDSAWYGFRVAPKTKSSVRVRLDYEGGSHRYNPKVSRDGQNWTLLPSDRVKQITDRSVELNLKPGADPLFVSAQEIFSPASHYAWLSKVDERTDATVSEIGKSVQGRALLQIDIQTELDKEKPYIVLIGRQHPPEVTGAYALMSFVETILNGSDLSEQFLDSFNLLVIPMVNPDGAENGNWRFNMGGTDLNRDWGPFTQPETQAVRSALQRFHTGEDDVAFFTDFHSTKRNLLYTQADEEPTIPAMFTRDWIAAVNARLDEAEYPYTREESPNGGQPISKNYMYGSFGIPSITYEVGDKTPRPAIAESATIFSEEMMRLLLASPDNP